MGADLYFTAAANEQWSVSSIVAVPRRTGHKGSLLQTMAALHWTSES